MPNKERPNRTGFLRAAKWLLALLLIVYVGWLVGLGPKEYRSASSYAVPAYFSDPDPVCRALPTPECLADMAEQSVYGIYDHYGGFPLEVENVGMLHARLGNFERADRFAAWLEERRYWEPLGDEPEGPVTEFYTQKIEYLIGVGKWQEALAIGGEYGGASHGIVGFGSKCDDMRSVALSRAIEGERAEALEVFAGMVDLGCRWDEEPDIEGQTYLSWTSHSIELLLLLHRPREEITGHPDYQDALWEWISAPRGDIWISWQAPPAFADYRDVLTSVDPNAQLGEGQLRVLLAYLLKAGAMDRAKEFLDRIKSRPDEREWLLDWLRHPIGMINRSARGSDVRFITDNVLTEEERRQLAPRRAEEASRQLDEETIEWARDDLSPEDYQAAKREYERNWRGDRAMMYRLMKIEKDYRHDPSESIESLKALSDEYVWRWYHALSSSFVMAGWVNHLAQSDIIATLFHYGEYEAGFEIIRKLSYQPGALTAAAWGLMSRENPPPDRWCNSSM